MAHVAGVAPCLYFLEGVVSTKRAVAHAAHPTRQSPTPCATPGAPLINVPSHALGALVPRVSPTKSAL